MKVNFVRKPTPSEIYPQDEFINKKVIRLSKAEFEDLLKEPLKDRDTKIRCMKIQMGSCIASIWSAKITITAS